MAPGEVVATTTSRIATVAIAYAVVRPGRGRRSSSGVAGGPAPARGAPGAAGAEVGERRVAGQDAEREELVVGGDDRHEEREQRQHVEVAEAQERQGGGGEQEAERERRQQPGAVAEPRAVAGRARVGRTGRARPRPCVVHGRDGPDPRRRRRRRRGRAASRAASRGSGRSRRACSATVGSFSAARAAWPAGSGRRSRPPCAATSAVARAATAAASAMTAVRRRLIPRLSTDYGKSAKSLQRLCVPVWKCVRSGP